MPTSQFARLRSIRSLVAALIMLGYPLTGLAQLMNEAEPVPGITTSGQPLQADLAALSERGVVTVIDLRGENEDRGFDEQQTVEALGMKYVSLPVVGPDAVNFDNAAALDALLKEADGPVLLHCASSNRVGALLSLRQSLLGEDDEAAVSLGAAAGMSSPVLKERVESLLDVR
jgi:uncharacterized protein (TIGR01244 family)